MTGHISFFVPGVPYQTKNKLGLVAKKGRVVPAVFNAPEIRRWKAVVQKSAFIWADRAAILSSKGCFLQLEFYLPCSLKNDKPGEPMLRKPDDENLTKPTKDALTKAGFWRDDCLVFASTQTKFFALKDTACGVRILVESAASFLARFPPFPFEESEGQ